MLVLARKKFEEIVATCTCGKRIVICWTRINVTASKEDIVRIGIIADPDVAIHRREIQEIVDREGNKDVR